MIPFGLTTAQRQEAHSVWVDHKGEGELKFYAERANGGANPSGLFVHLIRERPDRVPPPPPLVDLLERWIRNAGHMMFWPDAEKEIAQREADRHEKLTIDERQLLYELWLELHDPSQSD